MHFSVTALPTMKAFVFLNEQEQLAPPPLELEAELPELPSSFFPHEKIAKLKQVIRIMYKMFFILESWKKTD